MRPPHKPQEHATGVPLSALLYAEQEAPPSEEVDVGRPLLPDGELGHLERAAPSMPGPLNRDRLQVEGNG